MAIFNSYVTNYQRVWFCLKIDENVTYHFRHWGPRFQDMPKNHGIGEIDPLKYPQKWLVDSSVPEKTSLKSNIVGKIYDISHYIPKYPI